MKKMVTSIRLSREVVTQLKELSHRESLMRKADISWPSLVREVIEKYLRTVEPERPEGQCG